MHACVVYKVCVKLTKFISRSDNNRHWRSRVQNTITLYNSYILGGTNIIGAIMKGSNLHGKTGTNNKKKKNIED